MDIYALNMSRWCVEERESFFYIRGWCADCSQDCYLDGSTVAYVIEAWYLLTLRISLLI